MNGIPTTSRWDERKNCRSVVDMRQAYMVMTLNLQNDIRFGSVVVDTLQNCRSVLAVLPWIPMEQVRDQ